MNHHRSSRESTASSPPIRTGPVSNQPENTPTAIITPRFWAAQAARGQAPEAQAAATTPPDGSETRACSRGSRPELPASPSALCPPSGAVTGSVWAESSGTPIVPSATATPPGVSHRHHRNTLTTPADGVTLPPFARPPDIRTFPAETLTMLLHKPTDR